MTTRQTSNSILRTYYPRSTLKRAGLSNVRTCLDDLEVAKPRAALSRSKRRDQPRKGGVLSSKESDEARPTVQLLALKQSISRDRGEPGYRRTAALRNTRWRASPDPCPKWGRRHVVQRRGPSRLGHSTSGGDCDGTGLRTNRYGRSIVQTTEKPASLLHRNIGAGSRFAGQRGSSIASKP